MKGYKLMMKEFIDSLDPALTPSEKREALNAWKEGYTAATNKKIDWYEDLGDNLFVDPEYRVHPLMGHQVRSRHKFTKEPAERVKPTTSPRRKPKLTPYEADPTYRDPKEPEHEKADLMGVTQYPVILEEEPVDAPPIKVKSVRLQRSVDILEIKVGYDHVSNKQVLYSPLEYNERWDRQSQVIWLRLIGMSPKRISFKLKIKIDTVKNWLRALKGQPVVSATQYDWAVKQLDGKPELMTRFSSLEAKPRSTEVIG